MKKEEEKRLTKRKKGVNYMPPLKEGNELSTVHRHFQNFKRSNLINRLLRD